MAKRRVDPQRAREAVTGNWYTQLPLPSHVCCECGGELRSIASDGVCLKCAFSRRRGDPPTRTPGPGEIADSTAAQDPQQGTEGPF